MTYDSEAVSTSAPERTAMLASSDDTGKKNARFEYRFAFPWGYRDVRVQFWLPQCDQRWIFVIPRGGVSMTP
jgi:hypothetical protein